MEPKEENKPVKEETSPIETLQSNKDKEKTSFQLNNLYCLEGNGACAYCRQENAHKGIIYLEGKASVDDFEKLINRGCSIFNKKVVSFDLFGKNCCQNRVMRTRATEFKPSNDMRKKERRFESFLAGKRAILTKSGKKGVKAVSEGSDEFIRMAERVEELLKGLVERGTLLRVFKDALAEMLGEGIQSAVVGLDKPLVRRVGGIGVRCGYFTALYHRNKKIIAGDGKIGYPGLAVLAGGLKDKLEALLADKRLDLTNQAERNPTNPFPDFNLKFDASKATFLLELTKQTIEQQKPDKAARNLQNTPKEEIKDQNEDNQQDQDSQEEKAPEDSENPTNGEESTKEKNPQKARTSLGEFDL